MTKKPSPAEFVGELSPHSRGAMHPRTGYRSHTDENAITWRFYRGTDHRWRWQKIKSNEALEVAPSRGFMSYADCVADARSAGYTPLSSSRKLTPLSLVHNRASNLVPLGDAILTGGTRRQDRSPVLKKRVRHPAIEGIFGKPRGTVTTAPRVGTSPRASGAHSSSARRIGLRPHAFIKTRTSA